MFVAWVFQPTMNAVKDGYQLQAIVRGLENPRYIMNLIENLIKDFQLSSVTVNKITFKE